MQKQFFRFLKACLCCFPLFVEAQDIPQEDREREEDHSSFIALRLGANMAGKGFNNDEVLSPQANPFASFALEGAWLPHRNVGMMLSMQSHRFSSKMPDPFARPGYIAGQSDGPWVSNQLLGGLYLSKPFLNMDIEGRFLLGLSDTKAFTKRYERIKSPLYEQYISYSGRGLTYQAGLSLRIDKKPGWSVAFNYDLNFSDHPIMSREVYGGSVNTEVHAKYSTSLRFSVISLSLVYAFPHYK